jgi:hypothetical protein
MANSNLNIPPITRNILGWTGLGLGVIAGLTVIPSSIFNFKPIQRFEEKAGMSVLADSKTGDLFAWLENGNGERKFIKLDKTPESQLSKSSNTSEPNTDPQPEPAQNDVRSGRIFKKDQQFNNIKIDTQIKYRRREGRMLYRIAFTPILASDQKCPTKGQEDQLKSIFDAEKKNTLRFRFNDADQFWVKDLVAPLSSTVANNKQTTIIDSNKNGCNTIKELVFHGQAQNFSMPDFSWVDNGKLLFSGIKLNAK